MTMYLDEGSRFLPAPWDLLGVQVVLASVAGAAVLAEPQVIQAVSPCQEAWVVTLRCPAYQAHETYLQEAL